MQVRLFAALALVCASASFATAARAADYPAKPIRLIVPFAAGAATDIGARNAAARLAEVLGQPFVIDNRPGAGGNVATRMLIQAPADGYTLLAAGSSQIVNMHLFKDPGYDYFRDLVTVATLTSAASLLIVNANSPYKTAADLLAASKTARDKLSYGSGGIGTSAHLSGSGFLTYGGGSGVHVPYKSAAEIVQAVLGGQVDFGVPILAVAHAQSRAGKLRPLAVSTPNRHPMFPDVPTFREVLPVPFELTSWFGLAAAIGTPPAIVRQLHAAVLKVQRDKSFIEATERDGSLVLMLETPAQIEAAMRKEFELYRTLVAQSGARVE